MTIYDDVSKIIFSTPEDARRFIQELKDIYVGWGIGPLSLISAIKRVDTAGVFKVLSVDTDLSNLSFSWSEDPKTVKNYFTISVSEAIVEWVTKEMKLLMDEKKEPSKIIKYKIVLERIDDDKVDHSAYDKLADVCQKIIEDIMAGEESGRASIRDRVKCFFGSHDWGRWETLDGLYMIRHCEREHCAKMQTKMKTWRSEMV